MRILANENIPGETVVALRERGHDVLWIRAVAPGTSDRDVLARAADEDRLLLTFDKDFGELAFRSKLPASSGIILLRVTARDPSTLARVLVAAIESRQDWAGHFSVIEPDRIRMTPLPEALSG
jgi:predicted nuclease of predicted toxin-antitoxin system